MTNEQFEALVSRLEQQAQNNPDRYRIKVFLLAMLGNAYLGVMLLLIVVLFGMLLASVMVLKLLAVKLIIIVGFFLWMILKALWVRIDPPEGTEITAGQAPGLFAMIGRLRCQLGAPRFHHVLITDDFNAGVVQSPRLGIFGWHRNYLLIGLPLMKSLTEEQFKAVLAHEFGHLAKGHGRMSNWIYRQRLRWSRLLTVLDASESKGGFLFKPFLNWFAPYFNAYSFPMARANEYEADATSARLTSLQAAAEALTSVNVVGSYLAERYWPQIHKQADEQPIPNFAPYFGMGQGVATELDEISTQEWLDQAMALQTDSADTHPALSDRLKAINESPRLALPGIGQSADRLLGFALKAITESFDRRWKDNILPSWQNRYLQVQNDRRQMAELNRLFESDAELTVQEAYDRARLTETTSNDFDDALAQFRALHERAPDDPLVCLSLGARLLGRNDAGGCKLIEQAMRLDENTILEGCELLRDFHWHNGGKEEAQTWHQRLIERSQLQEAARKERNQLLLTDRFEHHGLSDAEAAELRAALAAIPGLRKVYFVRKRVKYLTHLPCYVLGYRVTRFFQLHSQRRSAEVLQRIQESVPFPGETILINVEGENYRFGRKFRWMRKARIL
jgi:Zn-dependent protease with chaperone function